jgi:hypothetical protein
MHTVLVILAGFALLGLCLLLAPASGGVGRVRRAKAALVFIPLWLVGAAINLWVGVSQAGYPVAEELPIFLVVFAIPAAVAFVLWRAWSRP